MSHFRFLLGIPAPKILGPYLDSIGDIPTSLPFSDLILVGRVMWITPFFTASHLRFDLIYVRLEAVRGDFSRDPVLGLQKDSRHCVKTVSHDLLQIRNGQVAWWVALKFPPFGANSE